MAKPRIFISSTYYDLKHIRNNIERFIEEMGYESILFESGDIPFQHDLSLDKSCYKAIDDAHIQILIIGGKYGSAVSGTELKKEKSPSKEKMYEFYNSITRQEYITANEKGIPIYFFVENNVLSEFSTYKKNRNNTEIEYAHVDSINIFKLIDEIYNLKTGNFIKGFDKFEDIEHWLKLQWAGLFVTFLENQRNKIELKNLSEKISELGNVSTTLKEYTEALMRKIQPDDYLGIINKEDLRLKQDKAMRLNEEAMIKHLRDRYKVSLNPLRIYEILEKSSDLPDFLKKCGLKKDEVEAFIDEHGRYAIPEYMDFFKRFI